MNGSPRMGEAIHRIEIPTGSDPAGVLLTEISVLGISSNRAAASLGGAKVAAAMCSLPRSRTGLGRLRKGLWVVCT